VALIGCGSLGGVIARAIADGIAGPYELCGVMDLAFSAAESVARDTGAACCPDLPALLGSRPHFVVEAATAEVLQKVAPECIAKAHMVVLSTGAFANDSFLRAMTQAATENCHKIYIASGALGGFDLIQAARLAGALDVSLSTHKPPRALQGAPNLHGRKLAEDEEELVFEGSAREAIAEFPQNVNIAIALSLAGSGLDETRVAVTSKPGLNRNQHFVTLLGTFGTARLEFDVNPSPQNPRSSLLAAYSVLALLRKLQSPIQI
jgi:aspartate dehydrogenase